MTDRADWFFLFEIRCALLRCELKRNREINEACAAVRAGTATERQREIYSRGF